MASSSSTSIVAATSPSLVTSTHTFSVKLTSKNYLAWKTQFLPILNYQNLHGHIDGSSFPPPKTIVSLTAKNLLIRNPEYKAWFKKDQLLLSWIFSSLTEEIFPYIIVLSTSQEVWTALSHSFGSVSQNRQLQLYIELQELKKNELSISEYLHKVKSLSDELCAAGKPVSPAKFNAIIYRNIGSDYHSIITALNLRQEPVSFYDRYAPRQQNQSPRNNNFQNSNFNASANYSNVMPPPNWFPDIAANYHLTPDVNALNVVNEYTCNDQLHVGNGQELQITHTSNASIHSNSCKLDSRNVLFVPKIVKNLISVQRFTTDNSCFFKFWPNHFVIKDQRTKKVLMEGPSKAGIYSLRQPKIVIGQGVLTTGVLQEDTWFNWARILFLGLLRSSPRQHKALLKCVYLSSNPIFHARTKHVELDYHFVWEQVQLGNLVVRFISSADQFADIMTKPLGTRPFHVLQHKLRLHRISPSA
ncbi:hypothetical protein RJ639_038618 [Escallonia herrerae]|uniref:Retrovirus-related Pol polyprotein from transposon TNT 1-94-like beta-barrel domain-containing protein n=1 Tax=Escallonia herrerae TaxID=1293975 RepID=A0AA89B8Z1_9ASTE|nr:hypothetical protein RJ639_038618 [Escallonia herrerae]